MKKIIMSLLVLIGIIAVGIIVVGQNQLGAGTKESDEIVLQNNPAMNFVKQLGIGWNLGSTLESCDYKKYQTDFISQYRGDYQVMAVYNTKQWSGWDASGTPYFSEDGHIDFTWKIEKMNSSMEGKSKDFSIQIINHKIGNTGENKLSFEVSKAQFIKASGEQISLNDLIGSYEFPIGDKDVTEFIYADLSKIEALKTAQDLVGGTLSIEMQITDYPYSAEVGKISAETYYETLWQNPVTTQEMIDTVKAAGFKSIRIPVTYYDHMDAQGNIAEEWLDRVEEVVNYAYQNDLYCIINTHHERAWLVADMDVIEQKSEMLAKVWTQISERFKDYDDKLLFEGFNEVRNAAGDWYNAGKESYQALNKLNQVFVDTVRSTGGNNSKRYLVVNTYAAGSEEDILENFELPKDNVENRLIVEVHNYAPVEFTWPQEEIPWTTSRSNWKGQEDERQIHELFERLDEHLIRKGIPVIVGEFGAWNKQNTEDRLNYINCWKEQEKKYGIACFWWDAGGNFETAGEINTATLLNRKQLTWYFPKLVEALTK